LEGESGDIQNVVLVIDEINRGNSAAIFGSVFQLLDRDADGWSSYNISINGVAFIRILELIGVSFSYDKNQDIDEYKLKPHEGVKKLETLQEKISFLNFDLVNRTIKIPPNLSIVATMNTSDSSIYYMDSAFKRRWDWEFIDVDSDNIVASNGVAFNSRSEWEGFVKKLNLFIKSKHKYIRGIEDKQIGKYFVKDDAVSKAIVQSKVMFFLWDNVFARDKKPLEDLLFEGSRELVTFGDFAKEVDLFVAKIKNYHV
jgi:5-methylcytosine-specific restriction protein B